MTNAERILAFLRNQPGKWFTDRELRELVGIKNHATVNQECRFLAMKGVLERERIDGIFHNRLLVERSEHIAATSDSTLNFTSVTEEWHWEGNVQARLIAYLNDEQWSIKQSADTANNERGVDILATKGIRTLAIEVKGYPSEYYRRGPQKGQMKPTNPSLQARHWFSNALLSALLLRESHPLAERALGLPDVPTYRRLLERTQADLRALGIGAFLVKEDGTVEQILGNY